MPITEIPVATGMVKNTLGNAFIWGTTRVPGSPDTPISCRVQLLRISHVAQIVDETRSDEGGLWEVGRLSSDLRYTAIAYDNTGTFDPVCKTNLIPSPMPPDPSEHTG